jgi:hypothetical protein
MKTLKSFPEEFEPLVIVTGDRREVPPQSHGDLLAYSVSNTDFMYLYHLRIRNTTVFGNKSRKENLCLIIKRIYSFC